MGESSLPTAFEAKITGIGFCLATRQEICKASISDCPISHASQLNNPFLGLPLETGKCESCGTGEPGQCEGHFGFIELPTAIYHPDHVCELKRMLSFVCLKCLKMKNRKSQVKNIGVMERVLSTCCEETSQITINEAKTTDGACYLELKVPPKSCPPGFWNFLDKYGFRYGYTHTRPLLASEVMAILKKLPQDTRKKLSAKGYFPQDGYIIQHLPVPPNCLSVPDVSDGFSTMSTDYSITLLKKVLRQVEIIKNSRSGVANFESHEIESNDLQAAVATYLQFRGTGKASRDVDSRFGVHKEVNASSTKAWLEKMKTLFIRKGSGFSSRSVITGDPFKGVSEIGLPFEIAQKITFEERVNQYNMTFLQKLVDDKLCLTYKDGQSTYSLKEGSKGHTFLRPGQIVHRRIMDGDIVFINRPPTTHKHSLQALSVYVHDDHTVKINPLICSPLSADFDGDCIHLFYPQSLEAKAEVLELFSVEKQLLSSHTGNFNLALTTDSLLSLKNIFRKVLLNKAKSQQLAMFVPNMLSSPTVVKSGSGPLWTASQILQMALPPAFDCSGEKHTISKSEVLRLDFSREMMAPFANDLVTSLFFLKGPKEVLRFFNSIQPLLMENIHAEGHSVSLRDFFLPANVLESIQANIQKISPLLHHLRASFSESISLQVETYLRSMKTQVTNFIVNSSAIGHLIDSKSESALNKVVQQIGFLGMQISDKGKFYTGTLVNDMSSLFEMKYPSCDDYPTEKFGLVCRPLIRGLNPFQEMVHSISSREVIVRSSRGLTEPGTLFKNLMAILRDVVICHDGTVRNMCSNSVIQFEYGVNSANIASEFCAGDPVGVLAATAMSNPAYKAVLDSSPSSNSSWEMMKEILLCGVSFKNDVSDRRVILYLNNCDCGRKHCQENAALVVKNQLKKVSLKDTAIDFLIEYRGSQTVHESSELSPGLVGHIHLDKTQLTKSNISMHDILEKCQDSINLQQKKKKVGNLFKRIDLSFSECCSFCQSDLPCIQFHWEVSTDYLLEKTSNILADTVCPVLLQTIIKGDPRISTANVVWVSPDTSTWIRSPCKSPQGELAVDVTLEKEAVKKSGDAWRVVMDSCLPIIHLIDTRRSIPYAIKQVQELLGISCAFEQAVQRLSTSVTMVTKGVMKDHLLLLANSMTCGGTLIGFNAGGIKSLSKTLNVQVPFMNATLFTPRKCFERAAEKCHVDNLTSIVGSCAWGKHVSVGTGAPFEILWDTRKAELNPENEIDVYNFLHLVNTSFKPGDLATDCLGAEIDNLDHEDEIMGFDMSPERESGVDKPTFEDGVEFGDGDDGFSKEASTGWGKMSDETPSSGAWGKQADEAPTAWGKKTEEASTAWGKKTEEASTAWGKKTEEAPTAWGKIADESPSSTGWGKTSAEATGSGAWGKKADEAPTAWGKKTEEAPNTAAWGKKSDETPSSGAWAKKAEEAPSSTGWGKKTEEAPKTAAWGNKKADEAPISTGWGKTSSDAATGSPAWGKKTEDTPIIASWGKKTDQALSSAAWGKKNDDAPSTVSWGKKVDDAPSSRAWGKTSDAATGSPTWGKNTEDSPITASWGKKTEDSPSSAAWGKKPDEAPSSGAWGKKPDEVPATAAWGNKKADDAPSSGAWGKKTDDAPSTTSWGKKNDDAPSTTSWGKKNDDAPSTASWGKKTDETPIAAGWGKKAEETPSSAAWGKKAEETPIAASWDKKGDEAPSSAAWGNKADQDSTQKESNDSGWGSTQKQSDDSGWGSSQKQTNDSGWSSSQQSNDSSNEKDAWAQRGRGRGRGWGRGRGGRGREGSQGRGPSDWSNRRPRPVDDPNAPAIFTVTRQRLDLFTAVEQDILTEIESIMKNIRRVTNLTGYNDGDPISADDQKFIIDNVLNYHPDKAAKMGAGLDYIMVSKHGEFQDSRCFYAVSVNGGKEDFSYRKCLENLIRTKYPDKAEEFIPKYFRKHQPRPPGWNKERGAGTPSWNRDSGTPGPEEAGTPRWNRELGTPGPEEAGTPGWNKDQSTPAATDEPDAQTPL